MLLPPAFAAMARFPQFILYRVSPKANGKTDKIPVDWRTGIDCNAHDPSVWLRAEVAIQLAEMWGPAYGWGFVFTRNDPFWFLDIDDCLTLTGWSALATELCTQLAGVAMEISRSGRGLHLFGTGIVPPHGCKNAEHNLEFYDSGRFVAMTGNSAQGDASVDRSPQIQAIVSRYFSSTESSMPLDWTEAPVPEWSGPTDDEELILKACSTVPSAASAFGGKASFKDLWEGNVEALSRAYPDRSGTRAFDASSADAALAQHLAFWTGKDCARIDRIMRQSALARDKWERDDYLPRTIRASAGRQTDVYKSRTPRTTDSEAAPPPGTFALASDLEQHFAGCVQIEDPFGVAVTDGSILNPQQFRSSNRFGGREFVITVDGKRTRNAWEAFYENCAGYKPPFAHGICFRPELESRAIIDVGGRRLLNNYVPITVPSQPGDASPFLRHLEKLFPDPRDRSHVLGYMAAAIQHIGVKFQWAPLIQGIEGNGKSLLIECMIQAIGERYAHVPSAGDLSNKFNYWMVNKLFIGVEEVLVQDKQEMLTALLVLITNRRIEIQGKGTNQVMFDNRANFMFCTNHKDAIQKTKGDRRYGIFYTAQQEEGDLARDGMTGKYFPDLYDWLRKKGGYAIVTNFLQTHTIPDEMNPAKDCQRAPVTTSTSEAISVSRGVVEQTIQEAIDAEEVGFRGGWVSAHYLRLLLRETNLTNRAREGKWDMILRSMGYIRHPALPEGRVNNPVAPEMKKSRLWVKRGSIAELNLKTVSEVARAYSAANAPEMAGRSMA